MTIGEECPLALASEKKYFKAFRALYKLRRSIELQAAGLECAEALQEEPEEEMRRGVADCVEECEGSADVALELLSGYLPPKHRGAHVLRGVVSSGMHGTVLGLDSHEYVIKITLQPERTVREEVRQQRRGYKEGIAVAPIELEAWREPSRGATICSVLMERVDGTLYDIMRNAWEWRDRVEEVGAGLLELFDRMCDAGFEHTDMHSENIGFLACEKNLRFVALDFDGSCFHEKINGRSGMRAHVSDVFGLLYDLSSQLGVFEDMYTRLGREVLRHAAVKNRLAGGRALDALDFSSEQRFRRQAMRLSSWSASGHDIDVPER
jgi:hypothetical protein